MKRICALFFLVLLCGGVGATPPDTTSFDPQYKPTENYRSNTIMQQRFSPIYGNEAEINEIIGFIASNLVVPLNPDQLKQLDGYAVIGFDIDTTGTMGNYRVIRSYNSWVDYALIGAMVELPHWGVIPTTQKGEPTRKDHHIVFTFGSYSKGTGTFGFQGNTVNRNTQTELNRQRDDHFAKIKEKNRLWNDFTTENSRLEYDIQEGLKQEARTLNEQNPLDPTSLPPTTPTFTINELD